MVLPSGAGYVPGDPGLIYGVQGSLRGAVTEAGKAA